VPVPKVSVLERVDCTNKSSETEKKIAQNVREEINNTENTEQRQGWTNLKKIKKRIAIVVFENLLA